MVDLPRPNLSKLPGWGAAGAAALIGVATVALPDAWLEAAVQASGIGAIVAVAEPPLGATARAVLALGGAALAAAIAWAALFLLFGEGGLLAPGTKSPVRRADAHPDAPPRRPLSAAELVPVERVETAAPTPEPLARALPADLETPLAAVDPAAIPPVPREPVHPVAPLAPGERLQTFALTPPPPPPATPKAQPSEPPSIEALLRRLEQGAQRRSVA